MYKIYQQFTAAQSDTYAMELGGRTFSLAMEIHVARMEQLEVSQARKMKTTQFNICGNRICADMRFGCVNCYRWLTHMAPQRLSCLL
eukprot:824547-Pyramimonas_sp.AAC.1